MIISIALNCENCLRGKIDYSIDLLGKTRFHLENSENKSKSNK